MNSNLFKLLTQVLTRIHYHQNYNADHIESLTPGYIQQGLRPYEVVNNIAKNAGWTARFLASPTQTCLTVEEERNALAKLNPIEIIGDQPVTCPKCGSRTAWQEMDEQKQHHTCLDCSHEFITEEEDDEHLENTWHVAGRTIFALSEAGYRAGVMQHQNIFFVNIQPGHKSNGERLTEKELEEVAARMGAAQDLLEALEAAEARDESMHSFKDLECFFDDPETNEYDEEYRRRRKQQRAIEKARMIRK